MVITVSYKEHYWNLSDPLGVLDSLGYGFKQENFKIEEKVTIKKPLFHIEDFVKCFDNFEISPKIRNLNDEISKLGYKAYLKDFPVAKIAEDDSDFATGINHLMSSISNFSKGIFYLSLLEEKIQDFNEYGPMFCKPGNLIYRLNGIHVLPNSKFGLSEREERDTMMKTVSKVFSQT